MTVLVWHKDSAIYIGKPCRINWLKDLGQSSYTNEQISNLASSCSTSLPLLHGYRKTSFRFHISL